MALIRFNNNPYVYYEGKCIIRDGHAIITSLDKLPTEAGSGFKVFDYKDKSRQELVELEDYSKYIGIWDRPDDYTLVMTTNNFIYHTIALCTELNFVGSYFHTINENPNDICFAHGTGKRYAEWHVDLFDHRGFFIYKIEDGKIVETTEQDYEDWVERHSHDGEEPVGGEEFDLV